METGESSRGGGSYRASLCDRGTRRIARWWTGGGDIERREESDESEDSSMVWEGRSPRIRSVEVGLLRTRFRGT
jgi:hypothetical protein